MGLKVHKLYKDASRGYYSQQEHNSHDFSHSHPLHSQCWSRDSHGYSKHYSLAPTNSHKIQPLQMTAKESSPTVLSLTQHSLGGKGLDNLSNNQITPIFFLEHPICSFLHANNASCELESKANTLNLVFWSSQDQGNPKIMMYLKVEHIPQKNYWITVFLIFLSQIDSRPYKSASVQD